MKLSEGVFTLNTQSRHEGSRSRGIMGTRGISLWAEGTGAELLILPSTMLDLARYPADAFRALLNTKKQEPVTESNTYKKKRLITGE